MMKCKQLYKYSLLLKGDEKMLASEILRSMKTKVKRAYVIIAVLVALLILTNAFYIMY